MAQRSERLVIRNEADAFDRLQQALQGQFQGRQVHLDFKAWPKVTLRLTGEGYDSTITPEVAQALVDLQQALNRAYARAVHHSNNARRLTVGEKREINFKAKVQPGSSLIEVSLGEYAEKLAAALAGKMSGEQIVITVLGLAAIYGSAAVAKHWLNKRAEVASVDAEAKRAIAQTQAETRRVEILTEAMTGKNREQLRLAEQDFSDVRRELLRCASDAETVSIQGIELPASDARQFAATRRSQAEDAQLNGHYSIQKVDVSNPELYRITVVSADGYGTFVGTVRPEALSKEQQDRLNSGTWGRQRLYMAINATRLRGEVTTAAIVAIEWPRTKSARR